MAYTSELKQPKTKILFKKKCELKLENRTKLCSADYENTE